MRLQYLTCLTAALGITAGASAAPIFSDGFEGNATGTITTASFPNWTHTYGYPSMGAIVESPVHGGQKALRIDDASSSQARGYQTTAFTEQTSGQWGLQLFLQSTATDQAVEISLLASGTTFATAVLRNDGKVGYVSRTNWSNTSTVAYTANTWNDIKLIADLDADTWSLSVNDNLVAASIAAGTPGGSGSSGNLGQIRIVGAGGAVTSFYVDDVSLTQIPEPSSAGALTALGLLLLSRRVRGRGGQPAPLGGPATDARPESSAIRPAAARPRYKAFTLIELLVVISIIALLIAMLLPALSAARETARDIACMSNERQMGIYLHTYMEDHGGHLPPNDSALPHPVNGWNKRNVVKHYLPVPEHNPVDFTVYRGVFACPSVHDGLMTYTMNYNLRSPIPSVPSPHQAWANPHLHAQPSKLVTVFDGLLLYQQGRTASGTRWNSDHVDFRHPGTSSDRLANKANFLCFDGHVEKNDWFGATAREFGGREELVWF